MRRARRPVARGHSNRPALQIHADRRTRRARSRGDARRRARREAE